MNKTKNLKSWLIVNNKKLFLLFFSLGIVTQILSTQICIVFVTSESIPYLLCLQIYNLNPKKGDLCAFEFQGRKFIKYISGISGEKIKNINGMIYVDSKKIGKVQKNKNLISVKNGIIPSGYVFMSGTHLDSFDSRYQEFGLIQASNIHGKVFGLLRFKRNES